MSTFKKSFICDHILENGQKCEQKCINTNVLKNHKKIHNPDRIRYICNYEKCNKSYFRKGDLNVHIKSVHLNIDTRNDIQVSCPFDNCNTVLKNSHNLNIHIKIHYDVKDYMCDFILNNGDVCGKKFVQEGNLKRHYNVHTKNNIFKCEFVMDDETVCGKTYTQNINLIRHMRSHTGEKPYICEYDIGDNKKCGQKFSIKSVFKEHLNIHTRTISQSHICDYPKCKKIFYSKYNYQVHINRVHLEIKNFFCSFTSDSGIICGSSFFDKKDYISHQAVHSNIKKYKCTYILSNHEICNKSFRRNEHLRSHIMRIHTGEKPIICSKCGMKYVTYNDLNRHIRAYHWTSEQRKHANLKGWCTMCWMTQLARGTIHWDEKMCSTCLAFSKGLSRRRFLQNYFLDILKEEFEKLYPNTKFLPSVKDKQFIGGKSCKTHKRQPDIGFVVGPLANKRMRFINVEIDEEAHSSRDISCELAKMDNTNQGVNNGNDEVVFLRIALEYKSTKTVLKKKAISLARRIKYWLQKDKPISQLYIDGHPSKVGVEYLYYKGTEGWKHVQESIKHTNIVVLSS